LEHSVQPGRIDPGELRRDAAELPLYRRAGCGQELIAFGVRDAGSESDDELGGGPGDRGPGGVVGGFTLRRTREQEQRCGYDKKGPNESSPPGRSAGGVADQPKLALCFLVSRPGFRP
jgi:hypothetical protein